MITDSQYKELLVKVKELEKQVSSLSVQVSRLIMKGDTEIVTHSHVNTVTKRDITKYKFEGKIYCKRQIVYECIKKYIADNNIDNYEDLVKVFPDYIQGSLGVIRSVEQACKYSDAHRRFYFSDEDIIYLSKEAYVICSQWDKNNIGRFLATIDTLGYLVEPIKL